jgi:2-polyprenyl-3-methyl-5-hydroxy-6-metoxy-1,4-benzoquinol methylase
MVSRFWDYESNFPERYFTFRNGTEMARQLRSHLRGKETILDYGCGLGYLLGEFLDFGMLGAGLDFSPEAMRKANERLRGHPNFLGAFDLDRLRESGRRFDAITVVEVIEHLYDEQLEPILAELSQFLTPEGIVIFSTPNEENLTSSSLLCPITGEVFHRRQHVRSWSKETLTSYLEARGYLVVTCFATNFRGGPSQAKKRSGLIARWAVLKNGLSRRVLRKKMKKTPHLVAIARPRLAGEADRPQDPLQPSHGAGFALTARTLPQIDGA